MQCVFVTAVPVFSISQPYRQSIHNLFYRLHTVSTSSSAGPCKPYRYCRHVFSCYTAAAAAAAAAAVNTRPDVGVKNWHAPQSCIRKV
jgi:hypothetical protein